MTRRVRGDEGFVAVELSLGVAMLLLPVTLVVLTLPTWSERQAAARAIAREVARAAAIAGACDEQQAQDVADEMAAGLGIPDELDRVALDCPPGGALARGGEVTATVTVTMPAVDIPTIASLGAWRWTAGHRQQIDPYLSTP